MYSQDGLRGRGSPQRYKAVSLDWNLCWVLEGGQNVGRTLGRFASHYQEEDVGPSG